MPPPNTHQYSQSVSLPNTNQSTNQSTHQSNNPVPSSQSTPTSQTIVQTNGHSKEQLNTQISNQPINQSNNQSNNQTTSHSNNQSSNNVAGVQVITEGDMIDDKANQSTNQHSNGQVQSWSLSTPSAASTPINQSINQSVKDNSKRRFSNDGGSSTISLGQSFNQPITQTSNLNALLDGISEESDSSEDLIDDELIDRSRYQSMNSANGRYPMRRMSPRRAMWLDRERERYEYGYQPYSQPMNPSTNPTMNQPIELYGFRSYMLLFAIFNGFCLLIRDASLQSFVLYLVLINLSIALIVLGGKPFAFTLNVRTMPNKQSVNQSIGQSNNLSNSQPINSSQPSYSTNQSAQQTQRSVTDSSQQSANQSVVPSVIQSSNPIASLIKPLVLPVAAVTSLLPASISPIKAPSVDLSTNQSVSQSLDSSANQPLTQPMFSPSRMYDFGCWNPLPLPLSVRGFKRQLVAGSTMRYSELPEPGTWSKIAGETFQVRTGPNYKRNKTKSASLESMYECVACDLFQADSKIDHIARMVQLPLPADRQAKHSPAPWSDRRRAASEALQAAAAAQRASGSVADPSTLDPSISSMLAEFPDGDFEPAYDYVPTSDDELAGVPPLWIVNFQIPAYDPPMFYTKEDGEGFSVVLYFMLKDSARAELIANSTPAARLLRRFVSDVSDEKMHGRYKSIPRVVNAEESTVGGAARGLLKKYNAKPFLTGPWCHSFLKGPGYIECDIDVHRFRIIPRKGVYQVLGALKSMIVDVAFVVEGHDDDELPEQIQGAAKLNYPSPTEAKNITACCIQANKE